MLNPLFSAIKPKKAIPRNYLHSKSKVICDTNHFPGISETQHLQPFVHSVGVLGGIIEFQEKF